MKNKNCAFLYFWIIFSSIHWETRWFRSTCIMRTSPHHYAFTVDRGAGCAPGSHVSWAVALLAADRRESFSSHSSPKDTGTPEKAEMTSPVTLSGNSRARLDLFLAMLFFFSPSATFNKCAAVFKTPLTTIKGEMLRISITFRGTASILASHINVTEYSNWLITKFSLHFNSPQVPIFNSKLS